MVWTRKPHWAQQFDRRKNRRTNHQVSERERGGGDSQAESEGRNGDSVNKTGAQFMGLFVIVFIPWNFYV